MEVAMTLQALRAGTAGRFAAPGLLLGLLLGLTATAAAAQPARGGGDPELRAACAGDVQTLCPGIRPGGGELKACLRQHADKVSLGCKKALVEAKRSRAAGHGAPAAGATP
jgi:hypothetical protein